VSLPRQLEGSTAGVKEQTISCRADGDRISFFSMIFSALTAVLAETPSTLRARSRSRPP
jgi:hypothetical protein